MKNLFNQFLKEQKGTASKVLAEIKKHPEVLSHLTVKFSQWLSGYIDEKKTSKRFQGTYRTNKFMVRKFLIKLA